MGIRIKSIWSSTWKRISGAISKQKSPATLVSLAGKLYTTIDVLSLDRFIKCTCDSDLTQLQVNPLDNIPQLSLTQTWNGIHEAFLDGMKDKEGAYKLTIKGKILSHEYQYELIQKCVKALEIAYDPEIMDILRAHIRVSGEFNPDDRASYFKDLQILLNRAQGIQMKIKNLEAEYAMLEAGDKAGGKTTRKQFDQLIAQVSIYAKFHIDKKLVTVSEFIEYYTSRRESIEAMEKQFQKSSK